MYNQEEENIIIVSDLHFDQHRKRNPSEKFRLKQSLLVAEEIVDLGKRTGSKMCFIAGDLLDKPDRDSETHYVVKEFFKILCTWFDRVNFILGNHDKIMTSSSSESRENDMTYSYFPLYTPEKAYYMDSLVETYGGVKFGFKNFSSKDELDLNFVKEQGFDDVDILICHAALAYKDDGECPYKVQTIDRNIVKQLIISGHIHQSVIFNDQVSIGVGQQCTVSDDAPQAIFLKVGGGKIIDCHHELLDPEEKQMKVLQDAEIDQDYYDEITNVYHVAKSKSIEQIKSDLSRKTSKEGNFNGIIEGFMVENEVKDIHDEIVNIVKNSDEDFGPIDLSYKIRRLEVKNFRTIKYLDHEFAPSSKFLVSGPNGIGKSSLFLSILYAATGETRGNSVRFGEKEMWVNLFLEYRGKSYQIHRGTDEIYVIENGTRLELGNKNETKKAIKSLFPFVEVLNFSFFDTENHKILQGNNGMDNVGKLTSICKILGLTSIESFNSAALDLRDKYTETNKSVLEDEKMSLGKLEVYNQQLVGLAERLNGNIEQTSDEALEAYVNSLNKKLADYTQNAVDHRKYLESSSRMTEDQDRYVRQKKVVENLRVELKGSDQLCLEYKTKREEIGKQIKDLDTKLGDMAGIKIEKETKDAALSRILEEGNELRYKLDNLKVDGEHRCTVLGNVCPVLNEAKRLEKYEAEKKELSEKLNLKREEYVKVSQEVDAITKIYLSCNRDSIVSELSRLRDLDGEFFVKNQNLLNRISTLQKEEYELKRLEEKLESLNQSSFTKPVELYPDSLEVISNLPKVISDYENYIRARNFYSEALKTYEEKQKLGNQIREYMARLDKYIILTKTSGPIYTKILNTVMDSFSDSKYEYKISSKRSGKGSSISIDAFIILPNGDKVSYEGASAGQQTMADFNFLVSLICLTNPGLLVLDEALTNLSQENLDQHLEILTGLDQVDLMFIVSHQATLSPVYSAGIRCSQDKDGTTIYEIDC